MKNAILIFFASTMISAASAQDKAAPRVLTASTDWTVTDVPVGPIFGQVVCGPNSTLYFRREFRQENPLEGSITVLSPNGTSKTINPVEGTGLAGRVMFTAFNVDAQGNLYAVANSSRDFNSWYLVSYNRDGHFTSKVALQPSVRASFLVPLSHNQFLVSGIKPQSYSGQPTSSITSIFNASGVEVRSLKLATDDQQAIGDSPDGGAFNPTIQLGNARTDSSGDVFIFKASANPQVQIVGKNGESVRILDLGLRSSNARPFDFFLSGDAITVAFQPEDNDSLANGNLAAYSPSTGALQATYDTTPIRGILACSEGRSLVYMGPTSDHKFFQVGHVRLP